MKAAGPRTGAALAALAALTLALLGAAAATPPGATEVHQRLAQPGTPAAPQVALTLDACGGAFDAELLALLVRLQVPATVFVTQTWLRRNAVGVAALRAHPALFDLQNHGAAHVPAVVGAGRSVYGIAGHPDLAHLAAEVNGGASAVERLTGRAPTFYRGATAVYDEAALQAIASLGQQVAGFSVNADAGATLPKAAIVARLLAVRAGDVVIAHLNRPAGSTAEALAEALPALQARGVRFVTLTQAGGLVPPPLKAPSAARSRDRS